MELSAFALKRCYLTVVNLSYLLDVATGFLQKNGLACFCIVTPQLPVQFSSRDMRGALLEEI